MPVNCLLKVDLQEDHEGERVVNVTSSHLSKICAQCDYVTVNETNCNVRCSFSFQKSHFDKMIVSFLMMNQQIRYLRPSFGLPRALKLIVGVIKWEVMHHLHVAILPLLVPSYAAKLPRPPSFYSAMLVRPRPSVSHTNLNQYSTSNLRLSLAYSLI